MIRKSSALSLATCLVLGGAVPGQAQMGDMDMGEHDGPPPMLVLMPPPDVEKPEGVMISEDPQEATHQLFGLFFEMMDQDGNGELNADELRGWVHPPPPLDGGSHMEGMMGMEGEPHDGGDGGMQDEVRRLQEELQRIHMEQRQRHIDELTHRRDRIMEDLAHMREEQARMAAHLQEMEDESRRVEEELQRVHEEGQPGHEG